MLRRGVYRLASVVILKSQSFNNASKYDMGDLLRDRSNGRAKMVLMDGKMVMVRGRLL